MPKFSRPNSYTGKQSNQQWTGEARAATAAEAVAGASKQLYISPATLSSAGTALVADATTLVKGKVQLATNAEAVTGTDAAKAIVPSSLTARLAAPGAIGGTTPAAGSFTTVGASDNISISAAGKGLRVKSGSNARIGVGAVLVGGTLSVANTSVSANSVIIPVITALGTVIVPKALYVTKNAGVGFTVTSSDATDTSTFDWYIIEAI